MASFIQKIWRRIQIHVPSPAALVRLWTWRLLGAKIGRGTRLPKCRAVWPHQVSLGERCVLQEDIFFNFDKYGVPGPHMKFGDRVFIGKACEFNIRAPFEVGADCLIASGCKFIDHDHGIELGEPMNRQPGLEIPIVLEEDVWLGANVVVLKGVRIGRGAIVGAGAVVTKSIGSNEIWAGVPAKKIGMRNP